MRRFRVGRLRVLFMSGVRGCRRGLGNGLSGYVKRGEVAQDRAIGPIITGTTIRQLHQRRSHLLQILHALFQFGRAAHRQQLDIRAAATAIMPQRQQLADLLDRKPKIASPADEVQPSQIRLVIVAIARIPTRGRIDQPDLFIMADHPFADARCCRCLTDFHGLSRQSFTVRKRNELPITATELKAMAAPAIIGFNSSPFHG